MASGPTVTLVGEDQLEELVAFRQAVWEPEATVAGARDARALEAAENPASGGEAPPTFLFLNGGEALGHVTTLPTWFRIGQDRIRGHWVKGLWVLPEVRSGPVGPLLLKALSAALDGPVGAVAAAPEAVRVFEAFGFKDVGGLGNQVRVVDPGPFVEALHLAGRLNTLAPGAGSRPGRWLAALALRGVHLYQSARGKLAEGRGSAFVGWEHFDASEVTELWERRPPLDFTADRTGAYVNWRYRKMSAGHYEFVGIRREGRLAAWAVYRRPIGEGNERMGGARFAVLADCFAPLEEGRALDSVLRAGSRLARTWGASALFASASQDFVRSALRRCGYLPGPGNVRVLIRAGSGDPPELDRSWLTRGDCAADFDI